MIDKVAAILALRPGAAFSAEDNKITWLDKSQTEPTPDEIEQKQAELLTAWNATEYRRLREKAYPSIGDQLDALWKGGQDAADMKALIDAVKADYPKPEVT